MVDFFNEIDSNFLCRICVLLAVTCVILRVKNTSQISGKIKQIKHEISLLNHIFYSSHDLVPKLCIQCWLFKNMLQ
jgi:hypothetical protein